MRKGLRLKRHFMALSDLWRAASTKVQDYTVCVLSALCTISRDRTLSAASFLSLSFCLCFFFFFLYLFFVSRWTLLHIGARCLYVREGRREGAHATDVYTNESWCIVRARRNVEVCMYRYNWVRSRPSRNSRNAIRLRTLAYHCELSPSTRLFLIHRFHFSFVFQFQWIINGIGTVSPESVRTLLL